MFKLIHSYDTQYVGNNPESDGMKALSRPWELYNLTRDISETRNLIDGTYSNQLLHGAIADQLASGLRAWLTQPTPGWNAKPLTYRSTGQVVPYPEADVPDVIVPNERAFRCTAASALPGQPARVRLEWNSESGFAYDIEGSSDLSAWQTLAANITAAGDSTSHELEDASREHSPRRFYRVKLRR